MACFQRYSLVLFCAFILYFDYSVYAQGVGVNDAGDAPHPSAMLDVSGQNKGVLINRMTEAERNAIVDPAYGLMIVNTDTDCLNMWTGNTWKQLCWDCSFSFSVFNNSPVCEDGASVLLTSSTVAGASYAWSGPNGFSSSQQNPIISEPTLASSGTYTLVVTANGCTSQPRQTEVVVLPNPVISINSNSPLCESEELVLDIVNELGGTYNWIGPNGAIDFSGAPLVIESISLSDAGNYEVYASLNGCTSSPVSTSVTVESISATPSSISGFDSVCPNAPGVIYSITAVENADSYLWNLPDGASIVSGQGTTQISVDFGAVPAGTVSVSSVNGCGSSAPRNLTIYTSSVCSPLTFEYTGSVQTFTVPAGVTQVTIDAYGAQGFDSGFGGLGGRATGTRAVTPGQVLNVYVGGYGSGSAGGWNGGESPAGGSGCNATTGGTGYGGGASDVRIGGTALSNRVIVAGGGGGRGRLGDGTILYGGAGGGLTGGAGTAAATATGGGGGTQSAGGAGGSGGLGSATAGTLGVGGNRCPGDWGGSDGGGGYYGGGGGSASSGSNRASGGGGSSFFGGVTMVNNQQGVRTGHGMVVISW